MHTNVAAHYSLQHPCTYLPLPIQLASVIIYTICCSVVMSHVDTSTNVYTYCDDIWCSHDTFCIISSWDFRDATPWSPHRCRPSADAAGIAIHAASPSTRRWCSAARGHLHHSQSDWAIVHIHVKIIQPYVLTHLGGTWPCFCYFLSPLKTYHRFKTYKSCKVSGKPPGCKRKKHILQGNHNNHNASWTFFLRPMSCTNFPATQQSTQFWRLDLRPAW